MTLTSWSRGSLHFGPYSSGHMDKAIDQWQTRRRGCTLCPKKSSTLNSWR